MKDTNYAKVMQDGSHFISHLFNYNQWGYFRNYGRIISIYNSKLRMGSFDIISENRKCVQGA